MTTGIPDLHDHDLRHTVGMRLREAKVRDRGLAMIAREAARGKSPQKVPLQGKSGQALSHLTA